MPKKTPTPYTRNEKLTIFFIALAGTLLSALALAWYFNRDNRWIRLVSPPNEKAVQILALDRALNAYVKTSQGNIYLCGGNTWRDTCRKVPASDVPIIKVPGLWLTCSGDFPPLPPAPGAVVDEIAVGRCTGANVYSKLIVLSDGSLWQWRRTFSWVNPFAMITGIALGLGLSTTAGIGVIRLRRYLRGT